MRNPFPYLFAVALFLFVGHLTSGQTANSAVVYLYNKPPDKFGRDKADERRLSFDWRIGKVKAGKKEYTQSVSFGHKGIHLYGTEEVTFTVEGYDLFEADLIIQDKRPRGEVNTTTCSGVFAVLGDGKRLLPIPSELEINAPFHITVPIKNVSELTLKFATTEVPSTDVWWGNARLIKGSPPSSLNGKDSGDTTNRDGAEIKAVGTKTLKIDLDVLKQLAEQLKAKIAKDPDLSKSKPTLAIAPFELIPSSTLSPDNAINVREDLSTLLIDTELFEVVERGQLQKAIDELKLGKNDIFDSATVQKLGKQVNARAVLIGSISDRGDHAMINVRLIDTATGKARIAASIKLPQDSAHSKATP